MRIKTSIEGIFTSSKGYYFREWYGAKELPRKNYLTLKEAETSLNKYKARINRNKEADHIICADRLGLIYDEEDLGTVKRYFWTLHKGYPCTYLYINRSITKRRKLHQLIYPAPNGLVVDHINRIKLDNRRCNLRHVTQAENCKNRSDSLLNRTK